jgi:7,8-dihydropterin-6-yl-methyl-4-(beta-D-ribofuranosyl)aminobenzene 5'-phosphate synthase
MRRTHVTPASTLVAPDSFTAAPPLSGAGSSINTGSHALLVEIDREAISLSLLLDGAVLITGEVDRTTPFEAGFDGHEGLRDGSWHADPLILDDDALVVRLRDRGLVILSGCGHAGIVNTVRARRLTGHDTVTAIAVAFTSAVRSSSPPSKRSPNCLRRLSYLPTAPGGKPGISLPRGSRTRL